MNQKEKELCEPPEWVKLVNKVLHGSKGAENEKRDVNRGSNAEEN